MESSPLDPHKVYVLVVGATNAGKSTFISCLNGGKLQTKKKLRKKHVIEIEGKGNHPAIGNNLKSCT